MSEIIFDNSTVYSASKGINLSSPDFQHNVSHLLELSKFIDAIVLYQKINIGSLPNGLYESYGDTLKELKDFISIIDINQVAYNELKINIIAENIGKYIFKLMKFLTGDVYSKLYRFNFDLWFKYFDFTDEDVLFSNIKKKLDKLNNDGTISSYGVNHGWVKVEVLY